jgi:energy-coupling factor transport system ATP-binding protein
MVLQNPEAQMIAPSIEQELAFGLENRGLDPDLIRCKVSEMLDRFDLVRYRDRPPSVLSGGERQRVALASALVMEPDLLLLDEPSAYLDPDATVAFFDLLRAIDAGTTVVIVEHKLEYLADFASRCYLLDRNGRISGVSIDKFRKDDHLPWKLARLRDGESAGEPVVASAAQDCPAALRRCAAKPASYAADMGDGRLIVANKLCHWYGEQQVLRDIGFELSRGETVCLMGPNGAGKTTLLEKLAGLLPAAPGTVQIDGNDLAAMSGTALYERILLLPQNPEHFFLRESAAAELELASARNTRPTAALFGLGEQLMTQNPFRLSEGEKRRLNLACAFLDNRPLLLIDEPAYGLDYDAYEALIRSLRELKRKNISVLMATHSPELAFLVSDRILLVEDGRIAAAGAPGDLAGGGALPPLYRPVWERPSRGIHA